MAEQQNNEFNDPALKKAVCRCWAGECASAALRKRVVAVLENQSPAVSRTSATRRNPFAWTIWPTALAASVLLSFGLFKIFHVDTHGGATGGTTNLAIALPVSLETNLIHTHDQCCKMANHQHLPVSKNDDSAIVKCLNSKLNQPVVMFRPSDPAWIFRGASVCPVGGTPSGHLVFAKGDGSLSIFSLPKSTLPDAAEGSQYSATIDQHCIVGFVKNGALVCMVSSGPDGALGVEDMKKMESAMQPKVAATSTPRGEQIFLTELLQPVSR